MTFIIPNQETKKHLQTNKNDLSGTIYQSKNINLDDEGYIKLANATFATMTTDDNADLSNADAICVGDSQVIVNSSEIFTGEIDEDGLTSRATDTNVPTPGVEDDVVYFNQTNVVSDGATIKYESASNVWTTISSTSLSTNSTPTVMCPYDTGSNLAIGKDNEVIFVNTSWVVNATRLTLPPDYQVSSMASRGNTLYIATRSKSGQEAKLFTLNSIKSSHDGSFGVGTFEIPSVIPFQSSVVCIDSLGRLNYFTGGGFQELATLPIYATTHEWCDALNDYSTVSNRAMSSDGDLIYINLSSFTESAKYNILPNFPSGIWCYDNTNGSLYHRYSPSYTRIQVLYGSVVTVDTTNNNFTLTSGNINDYMTGMPVLFYSGSGTTIPELQEATCYYLIKDSSTVFRLATTYTNALAGTAIDITNAGNTSQQWWVLKTNDYGWTAYESRLSVAVLNNLCFEKRLAGRIVFTANLFAKQSSSTRKTVIGGISPFLPNRGYIITPRLTSTRIEDTYNSVYIKYRPLDTDDKIIIKYKTQDRLNFPFNSLEGTVTTKWNATWTDTDTFTSTADLSSVVVGDEIEIISGVGSGHIAHVSSISESSGTYTVNLDEAFPFAVANDIMRFQVDNFTKLAEITSSSNEGYDYFKIPMIENNNSKFLQLKIEMRGVEVCIEEVQVFNSANKTGV